MSILKDKNYLFRKPSGKCFLPTSVAGFIQAKMRRSLFRIIGSLSPRSSKYKDASGPSKRLDRHSSVSEEAKLISSNKIQSPKIVN